MDPRFPNVSVPGWGQTLHGLPEVLDSSERPKRMPGRLRRMAQTRSNRASPNAHLLIGEMPAPRLFEGRWWEGTGLSIAAHVIVAGVLIYAATHPSQAVQTAGAASERFKIVFLNRPGPGGGGGGGGTST